MNILVVEDDERVARFLMRGLKEEGFQAELCVDGATALSQGLNLEYDLVLLDWALPDMDGVAVLRRWRESGIEVPVIMVTARGGVDATVQGLDAGADDYLEKPFSFEELLARIRAHARRPHLGRSGDQAVTIGEVVVNLKARTVKRGNAVTELSNREFGLLAFLIRHRGEILSRTRILDRVWGLSHDPTTNVVDVYIRYLREKLDLPGSDRSVIETIRGRGYRLRVEGSCHE